MLRLTVTGKMFSVTEGYKCTKLYSQSVHVLKTSLFMRSNSYDANRVHSLIIHETARNFTVVNLQTHNMETNEETNERNFLPK